MGRRHPLFMLVFALCGHGELITQRDEVMTITAAFFNSLDSTCDMYDVKTDELLVDKEGSVFIMRKWDNVKFNFEWSEPVPGFRLTGFNIAAREDLNSMEECQTHCFEVISAMSLEFNPSKPLCNCNTCDKFTQPESYITGPRDIYTYLSCKV
ncbi:hypothetical protein CAPTEDRAFT_215315 [Capitella teleta]|uniref:Apple domain-containing protein n=1 Tax=Capitella teleta TaxID=283909 RepID=R7V1M6_CAPTE|nr:hypothetical protein CAPTEDRAFT_215315 [Capitella teleta]|eukprot:ELU10216.1 hypothetical protein CAPTEDRAFT_215315 [Capitella teleta]